MTLSHNHIVGTNDISRFHAGGIEGVLEKQVRLMGARTGTGDFANLREQSMVINLRDQKDLRDKCIS